MEIMGCIKAYLFVSIDCVDTDLMVWMSDVYFDGRFMLIMDGVLWLVTRGESIGFILL